MGFIAVTPYYNPVYKIMINIDRILKYMHPEITGFSYHKDCRCRIFYTDFKSHEDVEESIEEIDKLIEGVK